MGRIGTATGASEQAQADELRRSRRRATGLLALVALAFLASFALPDGTGTGYLRAALEAGLVGGLADWFAVVALFRHPLGLPIPHTAVIPRSKEGLGRNLATFVRDNFLATGEVRSRIADPANVERLGAWLADPANADRVTVPLLRVAVAVVEALDEDEVVDRIAGGARRRLDDVHVAHLLGTSLEHTVAGRRHTALVAGAIDGILGALDTNRAALRRRLGDQAPGWVPAAVNDAVYSRAEEVVRTFLQQVAEDPEHELRRALDDQLVGIAERLRTDGQLAARVDAGALELVDDEQLRSWVGGWWTDLRTALREAADRDGDGSPLRRAVTGALADTGERLVAGGPLHDQLLDVLAAVAPTVADAGQAQIEDLITATVDRWDAEDTSRRLELWLGSDLQFVRINGTLVGAAVGVVLHAVSGALG